MLALDYATTDSSKAVVSDFVDRLEPLDEIESEHNSNNLARFLLYTHRSQFIYEYYVSLWLGEINETNALEDYITITIPTPNSQALTQPPKKYMSWSEAIKLQDEIHHRLKQEIDDGLNAEAQYRKYLEEDEETVD